MKTGRTTSRQHAGAIDSGEVRHLTCKGFVEGSDPGIVLDDGLDLVLLKASELGASPLLMSRSEERVSQVKGVWVSEGSPEPPDRRLRGGGLTLSRLRSFV